MMNEIATAQAAIRAAQFAGQAAFTAKLLLEADPTAWKVGDTAYWLCRAAQEHCELAADALPAEKADGNRIIFQIRDKAVAAADRVGDFADELVTLAEKAGHTITR